MSASERRLRKSFPLGSFSLLFSRLFLALIFFFFFFLSSFFSFYRWGQKIMKPVLFLFYQLRLMTNTSIPTYTHPQIPFHSSLCPLYHTINNNNNNNDNNNNNNNNRVILRTPTGDETFFLTTSEVAKPKPAVFAQVFLLPFISFSLLSLLSSSFSFSYFSFPIFTEDITTLTTNNNRQLLIVLLVMKNLL